MPRPPSGLLIDFNGVLAEAPRQPPAPPELLHRLSQLVGDAVPVKQIARDLADGMRAYAVWRDKTGSGGAPVEVGHAQVWNEFVTRTWPAAARAAVEREATPLAYALTWREQWVVRPGIPEALRAAVGAGLPLAVASNTLCGAANRDYLTVVGLSDLFTAQLYSDEAGPRKPNPELAHQAARAIGVPVGDCWFIGDSVHRDIVCAQRAGAGAAILMRSPRTDREPALPDVVPDAVVNDGYGLLALLQRTLGG